MPWVRIDENAMEHRKILVLSAEAFRLWVRGLAHCQKHLTDGLITHNDLKAIRGVTRARVEELTTPIGQNESPLWEAHEHGFTVHDYLEWNDSRDHVLRARALAKERIKKLRDKGKRNAVTNAEQSEDVTRKGLSGVECNGSFLPGKRKDLSEVDNLAADFLEELPTVYARVRKGARYPSSRLKMERDLEYAKELAENWPSLPRLLKMYEVFLMAKLGDKNIPGTPGQFLHMAPEMDATLRQVGQ